MLAYHITSTILLDGKWNKGNVSSNFTKFSVYMKYNQVIFLKQPNENTNIQGDSNLIYKPCMTPQDPMVCCMHGFKLSAEGKYMFRIETLNYHWADMEQLSKRYIKYNNPANHKSRSSGYLARLKTYSKNQGGDTNVGIWTLRYIRATSWSMNVLAIAR